MFGMFDKQFLIMKSIFFLLVAITSSILFYACTKKPIASFESIKSYYTAGDSLIIKNTSTLGNTYRWTLPLGGNVYTKDLRIKLDTTLDEGRYTYKLETFSKNRKLVDAVEQTVFVKNLAGNVIFWKNKDNNYSITVQVDYLYRTITANYLSEPKPENINDKGLAVFYDLPIGDYSFTAEDFPPQQTQQQPQQIPKNIWNGKFTVLSNRVIKVKIPD